MFANTPSVNWGGWPSANSFNMTSNEDKAYQSALGSEKSYMMCVSPYFYTGKLFHDVTSIIKFGT
jgi:hypothetical protein